MRAERDFNDRCDALLERAAIVIARMPTRLNVIKANDINARIEGARDEYARGWCDRAEMSLIGIETSVSSLEKGNA